MTYSVKLVFATTSRWKLEQANRFLSPFGITAGPPPDFSRPKDELFVRTPGGDNQYTVEIQAGSIEEVCRFKAESAAANLEQPVLVEDIGVSIRALNGFPGPYTKYAIVTLGVSGFLRLMRGVSVRSAEMTSVVGYCTPGGAAVTFSAALAGRILKEERLDPQNPWRDVLLYPIFQPRGERRSLAEIAPEELMALPAFPMRASLENFARWFQSRTSTR